MGRQHTRVRESVMGAGQGEITGNAISGVVKVGWRALDVQVAFPAEEGVDIPGSSRIDCSTVEGTRGEAKNRSYRRGCGMVSYLQQDIR